MGKANETRKCLAVPVRAKRNREGSYKRDHRKIEKQLLLR